MGGSWREPFIHKRTLHSDAKGLGSAADIIDW